jgi:P27 family predicted phage terminase small subunit
MGKRGPRPKPTALRVLHGDRRDRINTDEPIPAPGLPQCPSADPDVRAVWDYTVAQLAAMGCVTPADRDVLACYCEAVVTHRKASAILARSQVLIRSKAESGTLVRNPALQAQRDAATLIARYAQHFGLSPSARSEIRQGGTRSHAPSAERYLNA